MALALMFVRVKFYNIFLLYIPLNIHNTVTQAAALFVAFDIAFDVYL
jgi:hypothetical protein